MLTAEKVMDELAADFTREMMYKTDLFERFAKQNRTAAQKLLDAVRSFIHAVVLADELIATARYGEDRAAKYPHGWLDDNGKNDWGEWKTYIQDKENTVWEVTRHIATSTNGEKILYDIYPIK